MSQNIIAVNFNNQSLYATLIDNVPYVAMKPICENIGLDWASQFSRIKRHPIMSKGIVMITTPSKGGIQEMLMLPLKMLNGWLFGVDSTRVKPEIKDAVIKYQEECFDVLANHFMPKRNGLLDIPKSPYVTPREKLQLRSAIEKHCAQTKEAHSFYWRKLHFAYHVSTLEELPTGRVPEMLAFLGLRVPELDECILVKKRDVINQPPVSTAPQIPDNMMLITENRYRELSDIDKINSDYVEQLYQEGGCLLSKSSRDEIIECSSNFMKVANAFIELAEDMKARAKRIEISL